MVNELDTIRHVYYKLEDNHALKVNPKIAGKGGTSYNTEHKSLSYGE